MPQTSTKHVLNDCLHKAVEEADFPTAIKSKVAVNIKLAVHDNSRSPV